MSHDKVFSGDHIHDENSTSYHFFQTMDHVPENFASYRLVGFNPSDEYQSNWIKIPQGSFRENL